MPIISAKVIKSRKVRFRGSYGHWCKDDRMPKGSFQMRLYGNGCAGDPKYTMYICMDCAAQSEDQRLLKHYQGLILGSYNTNRRFLGGFVS